jgi:hypothetical protein
LGLSGTEEAN